MQENIFENIKKINKHDQEYWSARDLFKLLGYTEYGKFIPVIKRAMDACVNSGYTVLDHFAEVSEMISIATGSTRETMREVDNYKLSRYACYLIAQNGDPRKPQIANAQTYFAIKTREREVEQDLIEDGKRVYLREEMKGRNKHLASAAKQAGVHNYADFQDFGYMGLYGGLRQKDIKKRKNLKEKDIILDHMGSEELAANLFRATQAEAKLKREQIKGQYNANRAHKTVGEEVRKTIKSIGGTMPENLPKVGHVKESKKRLSGKSKKLK